MPSYARGSSSSRRSLRRASRLASLRTRPALQAAVCFRAPRSRRAVLLSSSMHSSSTVRGSQEAVRRMRVSLRGRVGRERGSGERCGTRPSWQGVAPLSAWQAAMTLSRRPKESVAMTREIEPTQAGRPRESGEAGTWRLAQSTAHSTRGSRPPLAPPAARTAPTRCSQDADQRQHQDLQRCAQLLARNLGRSPLPLLTLRPPARPL